MHHRSQAQARRGSTSNRCKRRMAYLSRAMKYARRPFPTSPAQTCTMSSPATPTTSRIATNSAARLPLDPPGRLPPRCACRASLARRHLAANPLRQGDTGPRVGQSFTVGAEECPEQRPQQAKQRCSRRCSACCSKATAQHSTSQRTACALPKLDRKGLDTCNGAPPPPTTPPSSPLHRPEVSLRAVGSCRVACPAPRLTKSSLIHSPLRYCSRLRGRAGLEGPCRGFPGCTKSWQGGPLAFTYADQLPVWAPTPGAPSQLHPSVSHVAMQIVKMQIHQTCFLLF